MQSMPGFRRKLLLVILSLEYTLIVAAQDCVTAKCANALTLPRTGMGDVPEESICAFNNVCTPINPEFRSLFTSEVLDSTLTNSKLLSAAACTTHTLSDCSDTPSGLLVSPGFSVPPALGLGGTPRECQQTGLLNLQICGIAVSDIVPRQEPGSTSFIKCVGGLPEIPENPCVECSIDSCPSGQIPVLGASRIVDTGALRRVDICAKVDDCKLISLNNVPGLVGSLIPLVEQCTFFDSTNTDCNGSGLSSIGANSPNLDVTTNLLSRRQLPQILRLLVGEAGVRIRCNGKRVEDTCAADTNPDSNLRTGDLLPTGEITKIPIPAIIPTPKVPDISSIPLPTVLPVPEIPGATDGIPDATGKPPPPTLPEVPDITEKLPLLTPPSIPLLPILSSGENISANPTVKIPGATDIVPIPVPPNLSGGTVIPAIPTGIIPIPLLPDSSNEEVNPTIPNAKVPTLIGGSPTSAVPIIPSLVPPVVQTADPPVIDGTGDRQLPSASAPGSKEVIIKPGLPTGIQVPGLRTGESPGAEPTGKLPAPTISLPDLPTGIQVPGTAVTGDPPTLKPSLSSENEVNLIPTGALPSPACSAVPCLDLVIFFEHYRYEGRRFPICGNLNQCYNLPKNYEKTISSLQFQVATGCVLYPQEDCSGIGVQVPSLALPNPDILEQFQDRAVSFQCYQGSLGAPGIKTCDAKASVDATPDAPALTSPDNAIGTSDVDTVPTAAPRLPTTDIEVDTSLRATVSENIGMSDIIPTANSILPIPSDVEVEPTGAARTIPATVPTNNNDISPTGNILPTEVIEVLPTGDVFNPSMSRDLVATGTLPPNMIAPEPSDTDLVEPSPSDGFTLIPGADDPIDIEIPDASLVDELPSRTGSPNREIPDASLIDQFPSETDPPNRGLPDTDIVNEFPSRGNRLSPEPTDFPIQDPSLASEPPARGLPDPSLMDPFPDLSRTTSLPSIEVPNVGLVDEIPGFKSSSDAVNRLLPTPSDSADRGAPRISIDPDLRLPGYRFRTSVVYVTRTHTITSCHSTKTGCKVGHIVTKTVPLYTTVCPENEKQSTWKELKSRPHYLNEPSSFIHVLPPNVPGGKKGHNHPEWTITTIYTTRVHTITSCHPTKTDCHHGDVVTETVSLYTTTCPITQIFATDPAIVDEEPAPISEERIPYDPTITWPRLPYRPSPAKSVPSAQVIQSSESLSPEVTPSVLVDPLFAAPSLPQESLATLTSPQIQVDTTSQGLGVESNLAIDVPDMVDDTIATEGSAASVGSLGHTLRFSILAAALFVGALVLV